MEDEIGEGFDCIDADLGVSGHEVGKDVRQKGGRRQCPSA